MSNTYRHNRGFTLLEVLVALVLLVILSAALYGTYFSLMRGRDIATAKIEARREISTTLDLLRREISASYFNTQNPRLHFVVEDRDNFGKPASTLDFTTIAPPRSDGLTASDQVQVVYKTVGKEQKLLLTRQARDLYATIDPLPYPQMEELEGFLVECYDGSKWVRSWDTKLNAGQLPKYVRVTVRMKEGEKPVEFTVIAKLEMAS
ncbi:MAG TPA: type II secretion system protein GspJ [Geobacteraceae bacterium]